MIPFVLNKQQFRERYMRALDRLSPRAIAELRALFVCPIRDDVKSAEVQIFVGEDDPYVPATWIYFQGKNTKVDNRDKSLFPGRSLQLSIGLETLEQFDARYFSDEDFSGKHIAANVLKTWFAECWWKAGGWSYQLPVSVSVHDDYGDGNAIKLSERDG